MKLKLFGKWRQAWIAAGICGVLALVIFLTVQLILRRTAWITLPDAVGTAGISVTDPVGRPFTPLEITPRTVQSAAATLSRMTDYARVVTITRFWNDGNGSDSASDVIYTSVSGGWTRADRIYGQRVRHTLTDGAICHIWYDDGPELISLPADDITGDDEQSVLTYEEILSLPMDFITAANYQRHENRNCVYLETSTDHYIRRYWIGVDTGLLEAAEILYAGDLIIRMESSEAEAPPEDAFVLPDGTSVLFS